MIPHAYSFVWKEVRTHIQTVESFIATLSADSPVPQTLRRSLVLLVYTCVESNLDSLCLSLQHRFKNRIGVDDLKGLGIERAARYVQLVQGVVLEKSPQWASLKLIQKTRNVIAHANGVIPADKKNLVNSLGSAKHLKLLPRPNLLRADFKIEVLESFAPWAAGEAEAFFNYVNDATS